MTKLHKAKILDELGIEYETTAAGEMICLVKMSTHAGDDCGEWLNAGDVINEMVEQSHIKLSDYLPKWAY